MGKTVLQTNDPALGQIALSETEFFSKEINDDHPLKPIKQENQPLKYCHIRGYAESKLTD